MRHAIPVDAEVAPPVARAPQGAEHPRGRAAQSLGESRVRDGRAVAEIGEQVEPLVPERLHRAYGRRLLDHGDVPLRLGDEWPRVAGPVVRREWIGIEILIREEADAHGRPVYNRASRLAAAA